MALTPATGGTDPGAQDVLRTLLEQSVAGIFVLDLTGRILYLNAGFAQHFGRTPEEMRGRSFFDFVPAEQLPARRAGFSLLARGQLPSRHVVTSYRSSSGDVFELLTESTLASYGGVPAIIGVAADVTARRRVEHALERATKAQRMLSAANSALMRAQREPELLDEMCALALDLGNYEAATIAMAGDDDIGSAAATAIATGSRVIDGNAIALPLTDGDRPYGALTLAAVDPDTFDDEEVALLEQLASDIAYGIMALRNKEAVRVGEQRSRDHAARLEALWKIANNPRLSGDALTDAMLMEACRTIRPGLPYGGALFRVADDIVVVEAFCETAEYTAIKQVTADLQRGMVIPVAGTAVADVLEYGLGTRSWDHMLDALPSPRIVANGWHSSIVTTFTAAGSTYLLWFASMLYTGPWTAEDHAYVEVMASFFGSQAQLHWQYDQIQYHQTHDVLTGMLNRSQFRSQARSAAAGGDRYAIVVVSVDGFAEINAAHGNMTGDAVLVEVAAGITERLAPGELAGRLGGDVFAVFVPNAASIQAVLERAAAFAERFRTPFSTGDREGKESIARTASIGVALAPEHGNGVDLIISRATAAVAAAKARGRNTIVGYEPGLEAAAAR